MKKVGQRHLRIIILVVNIGACLRLDNTSFYGIWCLMVVIRGQVSSERSGEILAFFVFEILEKVLGMMNSLRS